MMEQVADAVIIGGGIMGASVAHFLSKKRFGKVVLLEKRTLAAVGTGCSSANVRTLLFFHRSRVTHPATKVFAGVYMNRPGFQELRPQELDASMSAGLHTKA